MGGDKIPHSPVIVDSPVIEVRLYEAWRKSPPTLPAYCNSPVIETPHIEGALYKA